MLNGLATCGQALKAGHQHLLSVHHEDAGLVQGELGPAWVRTCQCVLTGPLGEAWQQAKGAFNNIFASASDVHIKHGSWDQSLLLEAFQASTSWLHFSFDEAFHELLIHFCSRQFSILDQ